MHQIVLFLWFSSCTKSCFFCGFLRAPNGAPVHAFLFDDFASYTKSCSSSSFFVVFFVHQIVLFSGFLRAPSRAFFWFSSCTKSCFFCAFFVHQTVLFFKKLFFVHQIVLFLCFLRAPNRAFFLKLFFVHQIVLFSGFLRAPNRAFLRFSSCTKWCPTSCHCYRGLARHNIQHYLALLNADLSLSPSSLHLPVCNYIYKYEYAYV